MRAKRDPEGLPESGLAKCAQKYVRLSLFEFCERGGYIYGLNVALRAMVFRRIRINAIY